MLAFLRVSAPSSHLTRDVDVMRGMRRYRFDIYLVLCNSLLVLPGHRFREFVMRRLVGATVGRNVALQRRVKITAHRHLTIGDNCQVNAGTTLDARGRLHIGNGVNISPEVMILTADHDPRSDEFLGRRREVVIGDRAWIATRAMILPGTTIGEGALVAAGSVVHGTIEPWTIVAGNPAQQIGSRPADAQQTPGPPYRRLWH